MFKFRTMVRAENDGFSYTRKGDARITSMGRFLRRWKLDEIPQLLNVIKGEMSLVGPRPDLDEHLVDLKPQERPVLSLTPGITGVSSLSFVNEEELLARLPVQKVPAYYVNKLRPRKIELELEYARNASCWSDVWILLKTVFAIHRPVRHWSRLKRVLFLTPYYPPEVGAPQTRIHEVALRLKKQGHDVSVLTAFPSYPSGIVSKEWRGRLFWKGELDGVDVYRAWTYVSRNKGFYKRLLSQLSFVLSACMAGLFLPRVDVVIVGSPPLFEGFCGVFFSVFKRAPYIFWVADLWPDAAMQMGVLKNRILIRVAKKLESLFYRRAALILAVTAGIRRSIIGGGIDQRKVMLFRNAVDPELFRPQEPCADVRRELGAENGDFLVLYAGTTGMAQQLEIVLKAAAGFRDSSVKFAFVGDGAEKENLEKQARQLCLTNVRFLGSRTKNRMPELINAADCVVVTVRDLPVFRWALPTKMFEAMACCKPVILAVQGEASDLIAEARAGICTDGRPEQIRDAISKLRGNANIARAMGRNGRGYVLAHFDRNRQALVLSETIENLLRDQRQKNLHSGLDFSLEIDEGLDIASMRPTPQ